MKKVPLTHNEEWDIERRRDIIQTRLDGTMVVDEKLPYNKGDKYEDTIFKILFNKGLTPRGLKRAGAGIGRDCIFIHGGKRFGLEIKNDLSPDYGQRKLNWSKLEGWVWAYDDELTKVYTKMGIIDYLNKKDLHPLLYTIRPKEAITYNDKLKDIRAFEDRWYDVDPMILNIFYRIKNVFYIQIGRGYGLYCLDSDPASLNAPKFHPHIDIRFRAKTVRSKPAYNYEFTVVIKINSKIKPEKSKFNIEENTAQSFPLIMP